MSDIYMQNIMDHYKNPRHKGVLDSYTQKHQEKNLSCGDEAKIFIKMKKNVLEDAKFEGKGCAISQASISILLDEVIGKTKEEILELKKEDILSLLGIELGPTRLKCALLGLEILHKAIISKSQMSKS